MKLAFAPFLYSLAMSSTPHKTTPTTTAVAVTERLPTLRAFSLPKEGALRTKSLEDRTNDMDTLFKEGAPLSGDELEDILNSVQNVCPSIADMDLDQLRTTLKEVAHLSHKDWSVTEANSEALGNILLKDGMTSPSARQLLERILQEGNWDGAAKHAEKKHDNPSWAVLVTGVNGIRKTTSIYQSWWPELLQEALICPPPVLSNDNDNDETSNSKKRKTREEFPLEALPSGSNSFFRQLDHMIASLCNEDFKALYVLTQKELKDCPPSDPPSTLVKKYSDFKAAIFSRYRTLSELLGARLLKEAQKLQSNCLMETSGRDVAMFTYVDHFFPQGTYNKLALHFTINDLSQAQLSVDRRMVQEIQAGIQAVEAKDDFEVIYANAGGPYGSEVLPGVQEASDSVWNEEVLKGDKVGQDWYKATIAINAHPTEPWTAQAVRPDGSLGTVFKFSNKR